MTDTFERPLEMTVEEIEADMLRLAQEAGMDRRTFLKHAALGTLAAVLSASALTRPVLGQQVGGQPATAAPAAKSRVVGVRYSKIQGEGHALNPEALKETLTAGLCALSGEKTLAAAWTKYVKPTDRVAVKWNELGGLNIATYDDLKNAVRTNVLAAGVPATNVLFWGRPPQGQIPADAQDFGPQRTFPNGMKTQVTNGLEKWATALITLPVVKMHWGSQMSISMKLHFGSVNNPSQLHGDAQAPMWQNIAYLNAIDAIRSKTRLIIADAIRPQWKDGPGDNPQYRWVANSLLFGTDPVAVDTVGCNILETKRLEVGAGPATDARRTLALAQEIGLGHANMDQIDYQFIDLG